MEDDAYVTVELSDEEMLAACGGCQEMLVRLLAQDLAESLGVTVDDLVLE